MIRTLLLTSCALISSTFTTMATPALSEPQRVLTIASNYETDYFNAHPESAVFWGRSDTEYHRFNDRSLKAVVAWQQREDDYLSQLKALDVNKLQGTPEYITWQLLKEELENNQATRICHSEWWQVNPMFGWHNTLAQLAQKQPVTTPLQRQQAIQRWQQFSQVAKDEMDLLLVGLQNGYSAPVPAVKRVIEQVSLMVSTNAPDSPFLTFIHTSDDHDFKVEMLAIYNAQILPALQQYLTFLQNEYLPKARTDIALSALPNGQACYAAMIKQQTTLNLEPQKIYQFGIEQLAIIEQEAQQIASRLSFKSKKLADIFLEAKQMGMHAFGSEQELLAYNQAALNRAHQVVSHWFHTIPKADGVMHPYPLHRAKTGAPGEYHPPNEDGSNPGIFYINTYEPKKQSRIQQEATLFHELIPGHHFQIALAKENKTQHSLNKYLWNSGFGEGWALYTERLADQMGLYSDDLSRLGMLSNEAFRAARCVVDPGLHAMNWSREQALTFLKAHSVMESEILENEVDRYLMLPAQATSYFLGKHQIEEARNRAQKALGNNFDIKEFHHVVLQNGTVTLPMLNQQIDEWIVQAQRNMATRLPK